MSRRPLAVLVVTLGFAGATCRSPNQQGAPDRDAGVADSPLVPETGAGGTYSPGVPETGAGGTTYSPGRPDTGAGGRDSRVGPDTGAGGRDSRVGPETGAQEAYSPGGLDTGPAGPDSRLGPDTGAAGTCGTLGAGGTGGTSSKPFVTFTQVPGYGWVNLGANDTLSSPMCGCATITGRAAAGFAMAPSPSCPTGSVTWEVFNPYWPNALCISGSLPALPASPVAQDHVDNWGLMVGFTFTAPVPTGHKNIVFTVDSPGIPGITHAAIHLKGDPADVAYCTDLSNAMGSGAPLTSFNTPCLNLAGSTIKALKESDVPNIDTVGVVVEPAAPAFDVSHLCFKDVLFQTPIAGSGGASGMSNRVVLAGTGGTNGNRALWP